MKLEQTKATLKRVLQDEEGPVALFFSGGSDSLLLLNMLLDIEAVFSIVCLDHSFTSEQRRQVDDVIQRFELRVFSYVPSGGYLIGDGQHVSLVEEYAMPFGDTMPFVRDAVHTDKRCAVTDVQLGPWHEGPAPIGFRLNLFGIRKTDRHYTMKQAWLGDTWSRGDYKYFAPLWGWTRKDVRSALKQYDTSWPKVDTGSLPMCLNCLCGTGQVWCPRENRNIAAIDWDPLTMTRTFKEKYNFS